MSIRQKSSRVERSSVVVVVVRATKEISRSALTWAFTNVVQPGDCVRLLVLIPPHSSSNVFLFIILLYMWIYSFLLQCFAFDRRRNVYSHLTMILFSNNLFMNQF